MSTGPDPDSPSGPADPDDDVPTMECEICRLDVPAGKFCGLCGGHLTPQHGDGPWWLRLRAYSAAPGENVFTLSLTSSLFPQLPERSRIPFRIGLIVLLVVLTACTVLRLPAALITVAALGLPVMFLIYLQESDAFRDLPVRTLALTVTLGIALGVGWVLLTGAMVARSYGVPLGTGIAGTRILREGLGIPIGGMLLMLVPALVVRMTRPANRESLQGFAIGALGALTFTAAATITRLAPQFSAGMIARNRPMPGLIVEAGIRGIAVPLTAAAVGGLIGAALWFTRPANKTHQHRSYVRFIMLGTGLAVILLYAGLGLIDVARAPQILQLFVHLAAALLAILVLRLGLQLALLHEAHDEIRSDAPMLCPNCGHVVPDMAFCPACGVATRASSQSSRHARREVRPVRTTRPDSP
ncbi:MAG: zinc ribbon domain-containing protein [Actinobacteria bacterium]|nr:zinc ribbon domain-containing protein [Actinomycetota bacterium]